MTTTRKAVRWLTYKGDRRSSVGQQMGPTTMRDYVTAVEAEYDEETDTTRLGFAFGLLEVGP